MTDARSQDTVGTTGEAGGWRPVIAYAAVSASNQMLWLTFTPITTDAGHHYHVSEGAIGWLAEVFPLIYVVLALPAGRFLDRRLGLGLGAGAVLTAVGALLRLVPGGFLPVLLGQLVVAIAQPLILNAVTKLSDSYLPPEQRANGIAVSSAGVFGGMVLALVLGAALGGHRIPALLVIQAVVAVVAAAALVVTVRAPGPYAVAAEAAVPLRGVWADRYLRTLTGLVCVGFGVFVALTTWLQTLLEPAGVSSSSAGVLLLVMVLAGVVGSATLPPVIARRGAQVGFIGLSVAGGVAGCVLLAAWPGVAAGVPAAFLLGALLLTDLPIILELAERRAGPAGGTATGLLWLAGNAAGLVAALVVGALVHHPVAGFLVLAALLVPGLPLLGRLRSTGTIGP